MILKSLTLRNFRQFTDEQTITFSTDPDKKVTIVMAESGVGKTTLIQAFQWVLYGECKYNKNNILNTDIKDKLELNKKTEVCGTLVLEHTGREYTITRKWSFFKKNIRADFITDDVVFEYKDENGLSRAIQGKDAEKQIKQIMYKDLFPYFFIEGESLTRVGEQMSKGKSGSNSDFVKAIKGLLGFNYLYETVKHLKKVCEEYNTKLANNTTSLALKNNIERIRSTDDQIKTANNRIEDIKKELDYYIKERNDYNDKLIGYGEVEAKQKRTKVLRGEISNLKDKIDDLQKQIFKSFSSKAQYVIMKALIPSAKDALKESDSLDKGIPGINVEAVEYMLNHHKCICGEDIKEGSEQWNKLNEWIKFLPPNNIGFEIQNFQMEISSIEREADDFGERFKHDRKLLEQLITEYNDKREELDKINEEIGNVSVDIGALKDKESQCYKKTVDLNLEKNRKEENIHAWEMDKSSLLKEQETLKQSDEKTKRIQLYLQYASSLKNKVEHYCAKKENEKRQELATNINNIFKDFYQEKISFSLDSNYDVQIKTSDKELSDDFTSGGQDVAVALAFIGAIIKVNGERETSNDEDIGSEQSHETYPLVLDAPTSAFGMKQMDSFSKIMPKITDQIIVFINDKDGPILIEKMKAEIGGRWKIEKNDTYHSVILED